MEKKQIVFIHGGNAYSKYEDFLSQLRTNPIDDPLNHIERKRWQPTVREAFLETCEVYYPQMPNSKNAKYVEWNIWFERYNEFLRDDVVLIGHSLGGMFLAKYLSENIMPVRIRALYFLAAPWKTEKVGGEDGGDFGFETAGGGVGFGVTAGGLAATEKVSAAKSLCRRMRMCLLRRCSMSGS